MEFEKSQQAARNLAPNEALRVSQQKCEKLFHVVSPWRGFYMAEQVKYPLPCGCANAKYISQCAMHQDLAREQHAEALTGDKLRAENARLRAELEAKK